VSKLLEYSCGLTLGYARMMGWLMPKKDHDSQMLRCPERFDPLDHHSYLVFVVYVDQFG